MSQPVITEEWRKIPGFPSIYEVSNFGEVRSWGFVAKGRTLKTTPDRFSGYPKVQLYSEGGKLIRISVHKLVELAFPEGE
ncbi:NUMOD4 domain-containing protein [Streptomyces sp. NPDC048521]|uniref:NUMOD4 domain-containing protein n=1 Tax=Streptomyces sp. NPDC048521 TaxID=3365566 RepID=UPI00371F62F6